MRAWRGWGAALKGLAHSLGGLKRLRKKACFRPQHPRNIPQGLKATLILLALLSGLKPRPTSPGHRPNCSGQTSAAAPGAGGSGAEVTVALQFHAMGRLLAGWIFWSPPAGKRVHYVKGLQQPRGWGPERAGRRRRRGSERPVYPLQPCLLSTSPSGAPPKEQAGLKAEYGEPGS